MKNKLKILFLFLFALISTLSYGQILKGTGLVYTNGVPIHTPRTSTESEYAVDVSTGKGDLYLWNRTSNTWTLIGEGIDVATNANVPAGAPGYGQSRFRVNTVPTLYFWTGIAWVALNSVDTDTNIYNTNGTITNSTRTVSIPGNLIFSNNSAGTGEKLIISYDNGISSNNNITVQEGLGVSIVSSENNILLEGQTSFRDVLSPSAITGNVNNYSGLNGANVGILSSNGAYNITGIDNGFNGRILFLFNSGSFDLTLKNQDGASSTENQFYMGSDFVLKADTGSLIIMYDTLIPAWRAFKPGFGGGLDQQIDTFDIVDETIFLSLTNDNEPAKEIDITESVQDIVGAMIGTQTNIAVTYVDATGKINYVTGGGGGGTVVDTFNIFPTDTLYLSLFGDATPASIVSLVEYRQDVDTLELSGDSLYISLRYDNVPKSFLDLSKYRQYLDTFEITSNVLYASISDDSIPAMEVDLSSYVNTDAQNLTIEGSGPTYDIAISGGTDVTIQGAGIITLSESPANTLIFTANEVDGSTTNEIQQIDTFFITNAIISASLSSDGVPAKTLDITESVQDIAGGMVTGNTETGIAVTYDDALGKFDFVTVDQSATNEIQRLDTFEIVSNTLRASLLNDGVPFSSVNLAPYLDNTDAQNLGYTAATGALTISGGTGTTIPVMTTSVRGLTPDGDGAGTDEFLREDGTWAVPPSTSTDLTIGGSGPTYTIESSTGTDVTIQGSGITLSESPANTLVFTATDASPTNEIQQIDTFFIVNSVISASLSLDGVPAKTLDITESVQDISGGMVSSNTEVGINVVYNDTGGKLNFWTIPQTIDTFSLSGDDLLLSITRDSVPALIVDLSGYNDNIYIVNGVQDDPSRYFEQDSTREFFMGQFPNIPDLDYDGTEKGYYYSPDYLGGVGLINGNGALGDYAEVVVDENNITQYVQDGNSAARVQSQSRLRPNSKQNDIILTGVNVTKINGDSRIVQFFNDTTDYIAIGQDGTGGNVRAYMTIGTGGNSANFFDKSPIRKFSWQYQKAPLNNPYLLLEGRIPATSLDTTADAIWMYNGSYGFDNSRPTLTNGIMSFHRWTGNGTNTTPGFITMSQLSDSIVGYYPTFYTDNGTVDSRDVEINSYLNFIDNNGDGEFNVSIGGTDGGNLFLTPIESKINYFNADGVSNLVADASGIEISTSHASDPITINSAEDIDMSARNVTSAVTDNVIITNNAAATGERFIVSYDDGVSSNNFFQVKEGSGIWLQSSENNIILEGQTLLADMLTPSSIASNQNDYAGLDGGNFGRLDATTAVSITGLDNGYSGRILPFYNISSTAITLTHNATSSTENRFLLPNSESLRLNQNDGAFFIYDSLTTKWRLISTNVGSPYTNSGRLLNGRSGHVYIEYQTDTLNDFALGKFASPTADPRTNYYDFGLMFEGDAGFNVGGKQGILMGSTFNGLTASHIDVGNDFELQHRWRYVASGGNAGRVTMYGIQNQLSQGINLTYPDYEDTYTGIYKKNTTIPREKGDAWFVHQGGGTTGSDTSHLSLVLGIANYVDTINYGLGVYNGGVPTKQLVRGVSINSDWETGVGDNNIHSYPWFRVESGVATSDTNNNGIVLYNKYRMINELPGAGDRIMVWDDGVPEWQNLPTGSGSSVNIYNSDGNLQNGGSQVLMDTIGETIRMVMNTGNTTTREILRLSTVENAFTRFIVFTGPTDSLRMFRASAGRQYTMQSYGGAAFQMASDSILSFLADSVLFVEGSVQTKTKVKFLLGMTSSNYVKRIDGGASTVGDGMISDGTDWIVSPTMERTTTTSGAGTLNLGTSTCYVFTGTTTTWTLPTVAGNTNKTYFIKNRGSGAITLNSNAGGNDIYTTSAVNTITINAGESALLWNDGTYFLEMY